MKWQSEFLQALAVRLALRVGAPLLVVVVWVAALLAAAHAVLTTIHAMLQLLVLVGVIIGVGALAIALTAT